MKNLQEEIERRQLARDNMPRRGVLDLPNVDSKEDTFYFDFLGSGPRLEIRGKSDILYTVRFFNRETKEILKEYNDVKSNEWVQATQEYYIPWVIQIEYIDVNGEKVIKNSTIDLNEKTVYVAYESSALGDTIAWMPIVEEFRKKHNCSIIVSTFHNDMFKDLYPNMVFVDRGVPVHGMHFRYSLGWFGDGLASDRNPYDCQKTNLQKIACDILGMSYEELGEIRPQLILSKQPKRTKQKYVVITTCSTAQFKYWNRPEGWQTVVDYLSKKGYTIVNIGKQPNILRNVVNATGKLPTDDLFNVLQNAEFFIGLPSGLAWLNWALGKKTIMISGISEHFCEFKEDMYRVENVGEENGGCIKCFNKTCFPNDETKPMIFEKNNWLYCPLFQGTSKHFECTTSITPQMVKKKIALVEKHLKEKVTTMLDKDGNLTNKKTGEIISIYGE